MLPKIKKATKSVGQIGLFDPKKGLPIELQQSGYIGNISYSGCSVNIQGKPFSNVFSEQITENESEKYNKKIKRFCV